MVIQIIINFFVTGSTYALIAFGFTLIYGAMNFFNMGYGTTVLSGAYSFYFCCRILKLPLLISAILASAFTVILMLLTDKICYYSFRQKRSPGWSGVAASMAVGVLLQSVATILFGSRSRSVYEGIPHVYQFFGAHITVIQIAVFLTTALIVTAATLFLQKTRMGKLIRAIADNREMARVVGIDVEKAFIAIIAVSSIMATAAGILMGLNTGIRPAIASSSLLKAIIASIVGGVGNIKGALLAGLLIGALENIVVIFIGSGWRDAIPMIVIIVFMLLKPAAFGIEETKA